MIYIGDEPLPTYKKRETLAPSYSKYLSSRRVHCGDSLTLRCDVNASPEPNVEWSRDGKVEKNKSLPHTVG